MTGRSLQGLTVAICALPAGALALRAAAGDLGANPIEEITHETGHWGLRLLLATLAVTPLRRLTGWSRLATLRRTVGLCAFAYACLHLLTYVALDHFFDWGALWDDAIERRYVSAGLAAFLCLVPLAATSTRGMVRRLGRRWKTLHRLVYLAAVLAVIHFLWLVKGDRADPLFYAAVLAALLGYRLWRALTSGLWWRATPSLPSRSEPETRARPPTST